MKYLSKKTIVEALDLVASEIGEDESLHELVIAGGAALVLLYGARESTKDVDAARADSTVREAARQVASRLNLSEDWLNDGAKGYVHGVALGDVVYQARWLIVRTPAPKQFLAMKLSAWRDDLDIDDARLLRPKIEGDRERVWEQVEPHLVWARAQSPLRLRRSLGEQACN